MDYWNYPPYTSVATRRAQASRQAANISTGGRVAHPITITGRTIAKSFWGKAWNDNLERYSDYDNRLPRGRSYVRNGSVIDLDDRFHGLYHNGRIHFWFSDPT